jgi:sigma-B regulation protein RsbU (phosphoserine phosphatase)
VKDDLVYNELKLKLKKGDLLTFLTDGILEAMNSKKEMYGFERLERNLAIWHNLRASELRDRLLEDVKQHAGTAPQHDDMTVVVVRVL